MWISTTTGPFVVMLAASLWAIDALIRTPLTKTIPASAIVFYEHLIGLLVLSPIFYRSLPILRNITRRTWANVFFLSLVSSVGGTILFTQALASSFATFDFITPLLLQKLQPVLVITLAAIFLKEKLHKEFLLWVPIALIGSYLVSFGLTVPQLVLSGKELVVVLALGATTCWGVGTILSKQLLKQYSPRDATFLRFLAAVPLSLAVALILNQFYPLNNLNSEHLMRFVAIGLTTGTAALLLYYAGLSKTKAHISTIAELMFPLVSVIIGITSLNPYGSPQTLSLPQIIGIILLVGAVFRISFLQRKQTA